MEQFSGWLVSVDVGPIGTAMTLPALAGDVNLYVVDAADFDEDGGEIAVDLGLGVQHFPYVSADLDEDLIVLAEPLTVALDEDEPVWVYDVVGRSVAAETTALVELQNDELGDDDPIPATVPRALADRLPIGPRDGRGEAVTISRDGEGGVWSVVDVLGSALQVDGRYLIGGTLPPPEAAEAPGSSPLLSVRGAATSLIATTTDIAVDTVLEYHISADPDHEWVAGDPATLSGTSRSTVYVYTTVPGLGTLVAEQPYYMAVLATNTKGVAPAFSDTEPSMLDLTVVDDLIAKQLTVGFVLAGEIRVGSITIDPENGLQIPSGSGLTQLAADGSGNTFAGQGTFDALTVQGNLTVRGTNNEVAKNASVTLETGVTAPKSAPVASNEWVTKTTHEGFNSCGLSPVPEAGPNKWMRVESLGDCVVTMLNRDPVTGDYPLAAFESQNLSDLRSEINSGMGGFHYANNLLTVLCMTKESWPNSYVGRWYLYQFTYDNTKPIGQRFAYLRRAPYLNPTDTYGGNMSSSSIYDPTLAFCTANNLFYVVQPGNNGDHMVTTYLVGLGLSSSPKFLRSAGTTTFNLKKAAKGLQVTAADVGTLTIWLGHAEGDRVYAFTTDTNPVRRSTDDFLTSGTDQRGLYWDGERFLTGYKAKVVHHSRIKDTNLAALPLQIGQTWRLENGVGPAYAAAETSISLHRQMTNMTKRASLRISSASDIPDDTSDPADANAVSFYVARKTGSPALGDYRRAATPAVGVKTVLLDILPTTGGTPPATTSGFTAGTPARLISAASDTIGALVDLRGEGSGRVGPLVWGPNGRSVNAGVLAMWNAAANFTTTAGTQGFDFPAQLSGSLASSQGGASSSVFTAPPSGAVFVTIGGYTRSVNTNVCLISPIVRAGATVGSGTVMWSASATYSGGGGNADFQIRANTTVMVSNLTPGETYHASIALYRQAAAGSQANNTFIRVDPALV